jgi:hypothetical protein
MMQRAARSLPLVILLILAVAYGLTLAPGLSWANEGADGGDLIAAAATGGVPHPTGYPLYLVLAQLFQQLPWGQLAFRTNLMSSIFAGLTALLVYFITLRLLADAPGREFSALSGAILFGLAPLVWSQAVITEVYTLQVLLTALILYQALFPGTGRAFMLLRGLLVGLALGNHLTSLFLVPVLLWQAGNIRAQSVQHVVLKLLGLLAGLCIYVILPLNALAGPPVNWENPVTLDGFFNLVSGRMYQSYLTSEFVMERLRGVLGLLIVQFGFAGVALGLYALLGGRNLLVRTLPLVWVFLTHSIFLVFYSSSDSYVYLIVPVLVFSIWIGLGISGLLTTFAGLPRGLVFFVALLFLTGIAFSAVRTFGQVDASKDSRAEDFGRLAMDSLPAGALVFTREDRSTFALWYFHFALKEREDLRVVVEGLLPYDWYRQSLRDTYPDLHVPDSPAFSVQKMITLNPGLPACYVGHEERTVITCIP